MSERSFSIALRTLESGIMELIWRSVVFGAVDFWDLARLRGFAGIDGMKCNRMRYQLLLY